MLTPKTSLLQVRLEPALFDRLKAAAEGYGMSVSSIVRYQLVAICESHERKVRYAQQSKKS